jgi:hypothetical protein
MSSGRRLSAGPIWFIAVAPYLRLAVMGMQRSEIDRVAPVPVADVAASLPLVDRMLKFLAGIEGFIVASGRDDQARGNARAFAGPTRA